MNTEEHSRGDLPFSPDFAGRVLDEADRVAARRGNVMRLGGLAAAVAVTGAFGLWSMIGARAPAPPSMIVANAQTMSGAVAESARTEPMDYMFPEAAPLAEFADEYSGAVAGATTARQNILFAGEAEEGSE
jgi:hypothetical protein